MSDTIETCEVDGCENDAYAVGGLRGEDNEAIGETPFCRKHIGGLFLEIRVSRYRCPTCSDEIITNSMVDSKFENALTLYCIHDDEIVQMNVISDDSVRQ